MHSKLKMNSKRSGGGDSDIHSGGVSDGGHSGGDRGGDRGGESDSHISGVSDDGHSGGHRGGDSESENDSESESEYDSESENGVGEFSGDKAWENVTRIGKFPAGRSKGSTIKKRDGLKRKHPQRYVGRPGRDEYTVPDKYEELVAKGLADATKGLT